MVVRIGYGLEGEAMNRDPEQDAEKNDQTGEDSPADFDIEELLPQYFELCRRDLRRLRSACELRHFGDVRIIGHNLKGSGGAYGFPELSQIGAGIETAAKSGDEMALRAGIEQLALFLGNHTHGF
jgi:HPt (histidine-containing phosphotransfer) domain-containing protein